MPYEIQLEKFAGPLDALLDLIEQRTLDVTEIALSEITQDFLKYLQTSQQQMAQGGLTREELRMLADFITVASRLILIKSKTLLPDLSLTQEEESEIKDLEARLKLYQQIKPMIKAFASAWKHAAPEAARPYLFQITAGFLGMKEGSYFFYPSPTLSAETITAAAARVFENLEKLEYDTQTIQEKIVSLEEEMRSIIKRITDAGDTSFSKISGERSKGEVIVAFLAILHLARDQVISVNQAAHFSDIMIKHEQPKTPSASALEQ